jgi:exodeoxyribonuclease VII small subunit
MKNEKTKMNFQNKTDRIQEILSLLDSGEQSIENMIVLYEEGMKLSAECREYLEKVEGKIIDITKAYSIDSNSINKDNISE